MSNIYLPYQKIPRWNADQATIVLNCTRLGLPVPMLAMPIWRGVGSEEQSVEGNNIKGTIASDWQWVLSKYGPVLRTGNANNSYMSLDREPLFDGLTEVAFEFIVKWNSTGSSDAIVSKRSAWSATGIPFEIQYNTAAGWKFSFTVKGIDNRLHYLADPTVGQWYHLVCTWDGATQKVYLDGEEKASQACVVTITDNNTTVTLGALPGGTEYGDLDYAKIACYPRGLSTNQVQTLYNNPFGMFEPIRSPAIWAVPLGPTTAAPTTISPTTVSPTTLAPTTLAPTTLAPTTIAPTTIAPTTLPPTSLAPTTLAPTTEAPTTPVYTTVGPTTVHVATTPISTTVTPTTLAPTTLAPTTIAATTQAPPTTIYQTTLGPTTKPPTTTTAPTTGAPTSLPPTTISPTTLAPTTTAPTTIAPTSLAPTTLLPTTLAFTTIGPTTILPTTLAPSTSVPTTTLTTVPPTTAAPETICIKALNSTIIKELSLRSLITKEIRSNGYLC